VARVIFQTALAIGTLTGGYLYQIWNPLPYILTGGTDIFLIIILFKMVEPRVDSEKFTPRSYLKKNVDGFSEIFKNHHVLFLSIFYITVGGITWTAQIFFNQTFASEIGMSVIEKSWFFAVIRMINSLTVYKLITLRLVNKKRAFLIFPGVMMLAFLPGIFAQKMSGMMMVWLATLIGTARFTILDKYTNDEFESRHRATAISALSMLVSTIYIILMLFGGPIMERFSSRFMFTILGLLTILFVLPVGVKLWKEEK
jgi:hypothetical protein